MAKLEKQNKELSKKNFEKSTNNVFVDDKDSDSDDEVSDASVEENGAEPSKGFFQRSPLDSCSSFVSFSEAPEALTDPLLTPRSFSSSAAKRIEKEETWKLNIEKSQTKTSKRPLTSPTDNSRNVRSKGASRSSGLRAPQFSRK